MSQMKNPPEKSGFFVFIRVLELLINSSYNFFNIKLKTTKPGGDLLMIFIVN